jgi:transcription initiation factor TFIID subunit 5
LAKKGYTKTEAMLRAESANQDVSRTIEGALAPPSGPPRYLDAFEKLKAWIEDTLDVYKPELRRLLWPVFVHCYLNLVVQGYSNASRQFFQANSKLFRQEHDVDLRGLERITLPEHLEGDNIAKLYRTNKYRLTLSDPAYTHLMQFLESMGANYTKLLLPIVESQLDLRHVDRAMDDRFSFAAMLMRSKEVQDMPAEDEGIPGHRPGNAVSSTDHKLGNTLAMLKLGKLQMDRELESDVRADLEDLDAREPPAAGQKTYVETHELVNIKQEEDDDGPTRSEIPYPTPTARDVAMEVQKIRENRDRFKIETRVGGIGPGVSVCMYTFHNTFDSITCLDFSGDNALVAAGTSESYIRVWSMDGKAIPSNADSQPSNSRRLIGHSGPIYAVSFAPSAESPPLPNDVKPDTKWLLSSSADSTIRLWNLDIWQQLVVYKGHIGPVWSVEWGPFGHYFVSGGHDKTARIWSTDKIRHLRILPGHDADVDVVTWHPNSAYVFTASSDKTVRMWAMSNGQPVRMFTSHTTAITALCCSPSGKLLASGDDAGWILIWDLSPGKLLKKMRGHGKGGIWSLSFSVESTVLTSGGADGTVRVWDVTGPPKDVSTAAKLPGEPGKIDGAGPSAVGPAVSLAGASGPRRRGKDAVVSEHQISAFPTKNTPLYKVKFTRMNLVLAGGAYMG